MNLAVFLQSVRTHFKSHVARGFIEVFEKLNSRFLNFKYHILVERIRFTEIRSNAGMRGGFFQLL